MINEISPGIFNSKYVHEPDSGDDDLLLCYRDNQVLLKRSVDDYEFPKRRDLQECTEEPVYLFSINSDRCFGLMNPKLNDTTFEYQDIFILRSIKSKELA